MSPRSSSSSLELSGVDVTYVASLLRDRLVVIAEGIRYAQRMRAAERTKKCEDLRAEEEYVRTLLCRFGGRE